MRMVVEVVDLLVRDNHHRQNYGCIFTPLLHCRRGTQSTISEPKGSLRKLLLRLKPVQFGGQDVSPFSPFQIANEAYLQLHFFMSHTVASPRRES